MRYILYAFILYTSLFNPVIASDSGPYTLSEHYNVGDQYMGIRLQGTIQIPAIKKFGFRLIELSDLAWDQQKQLLYAVNDRGVLFHLKPLFIDHQLASIQIIKAYPLLNSNNQRLAKKFRDSEGMSLYSDNNLAISFENRPRIELYSPTGKYLRALTLAPALTKTRSYHSRNKMLEALIWHPQHGLLTGAEYPLNKQTDHQIFDELGHSWYFPPNKAPNSALVALENWPDSDNDLLVLERAYVSAWKPLIVSLQRLYDCPTRQTGRCKTETVAEFNSSQGWRIDNFEGLAHHQQRYFFMISDDNNSLLQQTILVYFEII